MSGVMDLQTATVQHEDDESALQHHIRTKGGGYYYAHKRNQEWDESMKWDGKAEPRRLETKAPAPTDVSKPIKAISGYGFEDQTSKVRVYVVFDGVGDLPDEKIKLDNDEDSFTLSIETADAKHVLKVNTYEPITSAKLRKKPNKIVLTLTKENEFTWTSLRKAD
jgi:hypothetical protein